MRTLIRLTPVLLLVSTARADEGSMTKAERSYLLTQLRTSKTELLSSIKGLTVAQWTFKPAPDVWSVEECVEHLILAEDLLFSSAGKTMATPAVPRLQNATAEGDRKIVAQVEDRSVKGKAPPAIEPTGRFPTPLSAAQEFTIRRDRTIAFVKTTKGALRIHSGPGPAAATADAYQILLVMAAHSVRHTAQIREVEASFKQNGVSE